LTQGLFLFALINCLATPLIVAHTFGEEFGLTELDKAENYLQLEDGVQDSWGPMRCALDQLVGHPEKTLYQRIFFEEKIKFQYPPTSLLAAAAVSRQRKDGTHIVTRRANDLSWLFVALTATAGILIFQRGLSQDKVLHRGSAWNRAILGVLVGGLALTFYPVIKAYSLGQIQTWINGLFAISLWCWLAGRKRWAGLLIGLMCLIKPHYSVIVLWGLFRREWRFVAVSAATGVVGLAISISMFGWNNHVDYLRVLSFMSRHGESFYPNQSINGLLNRLLFNGNNLDWEPNAFAPYNSAVYFGTLISSLILLSLALFWRADGREKGSAIDFSLMALAGTMASPIAWEHHYGILLPIYAMLLPRLLQEKNAGGMIALLAASYALTSHFWPVANCLSETPFNFIQSYLFLGALIVMGLLLRLRSGGEARPWALSRFFKAEGAVWRWLSRRLVKSWPRLKFRR